MRWPEPCGHGGFSSFISLAACAAGDEVLRVGALKKTEQSLSFERNFLCPADTGASLYCCLGRLRRGQGGAGYGAAPPSRPPLHPPRSTPLSYPDRPIFFFGGGYARTSPTCRLRFFMTPPPAFARTLPEKQHRLCALFAWQNYGEACLICCFLTQEKDHAQARIIWQFFS